MIGELELVARFVVGGTFLFAGGSKLADLSAFFNAVLSFELITPLYGRILAWSLPFSEILIGLMLFVGVALPLSAYLVLLLLIGFCIVLIIARRRGKSINCGCFGANGASIPYGVSLFRNLMLIILAIFIAVGTTTLHPLFFWQVVMSRDVFTLLVAAGVVISYRLGSIVWEICQKI